MNNQEVTRIATKSFLAIIGCGCLIYVSIGAVVLYALFLHAREDAQVVTCINNQRQIALALALYATSHNGTLPPASQWVDSIQPYLRPGFAPLACPSAPALEYGYAFFRPLGGHKISSFPGDTPMIFDSTAGQRNYADKGQSLAFRHEGGVTAVVTFVNGVSKQISQTSFREIFKIKP